jgi:hypothetical protein
VPKAGWLADLRASCALEDSSIQGDVEKTKGDCARKAAEGFARWINEFQEKLYPVAPSDSKQVSGLAKRLTS